MLHLIRTQFKMKRSLVAGLTLFSLGCSTVGKVVLNTDPPQSQVYLVDVNTGQVALLGETPMAFSKNLPEGKGAEVLQLKIEKEGFETKYTSVASFGDETTYLDLKMGSLLDANNNLRKAFETNRQLMTDANRLAASRRFSEALTRVERVIEGDPKNDEAWAAKGSLLYLMKDYDGALNSWKKSLEMNPNNESVRASILDLNMSLKHKREPAQAGGKNE